MNVRAMENNLFPIYFFFVFLFAVFALLVFAFTFFFFAGFLLQGQGIYFSPPLLVLNI